ncbi:Mediator of RNA polymerase II transcription subunit 15a [Bienertia sinuspersici]
MDSSYQRPPQSDAQPPMDGGDWRSQLPPETRKTMVNHLIGTLMRQLPFSGQEGLQEVKQIAIRFEEDMYSAAKNERHYLKKIFSKWHTMELKSLNNLPTAVPLNSAGLSRNPQDSASQSIQSQVQNLSQSVPLQMVSNQSQARQQLLAQNMQNTITSAGLRTTFSLPNSMAPASGLTQNSELNVSQNTTMPSVSDTPQNSMGNTMNEGVASNMFTNSQHTQQVASNQQHQSQNISQHMYLQQLMMQKLQPGNNQQPILQTPLQQQQSSSQPQQTIMQHLSAAHPSMTSGLQQDQQFSIQQPSQSVHQQSTLRQQQQPQQAPSIQQLQAQLSQLSMTSQAQLMAQQSNAANMQQNQLIAQHNNISDSQLQQQNNLQNVPSQQQTSHQNMQQQQHFMVQQGNLANMHQHQSHVGRLPQQQLMWTELGNNNFQPNQHSVHMIQQPKAPAQQHNQNASLLPGDWQLAQLQFQLQLLSMSYLQSRSTPLQRQMDLQQLTYSHQHNMQPWMQNPNSLLQQQNVIDLQKQLFQSQRGPPDGPSSSLDSTAQTTNAGDWQEEVYQQIKILKDRYFTELNEIYQKVSMKLQQHESHPQQTKMEVREKLKRFKAMLEKIMHILQTSKNDILSSYIGRIPTYEKQIIRLLNANDRRRLAHSLQREQIHPQMQSVQQAQQPHDITQKQFDDN